MLLEATGITKVFGKLTRPSKLVMWNMLNKSRHSEMVINDLTLRPQLPDGAVEIDGVPVHDRCGDQAEAGGAEGLVLERAVTDLALPMEEDGAAQGIARLALVQPGVAALAQGRIRQPLQGEQRALDPAERPQGARQGIAWPGRGKFAQDDRR